MKSSGPEPTLNSHSLIDHHQELLHAEADYIFTDWNEISSNQDQIYIPELHYFAQAIESASKESVQKTVMTISQNPFEQDIELDGMSNYIEKIINTAEDEILLKNELDFLFDSQDIIDSTSYKNGESTLSVEEIEFLKEWGKSIGKIANYGLISAHETLIVENNFAKEPENLSPEEIVIFESKDSIDGIYPKMPVNFVSPQIYSSTNDTAKTSKKLSYNKLNLMWEFLSKVSKF